MGEVHTQQDIINSIFKDYDNKMRGELTVLQLQAMHQDIRVGGLSLPQVQESIKYVCIGDGCEVSELYDLMIEMDRRYFLVQDFKWEFSMLDRENKDTITEDQAKALATSGAVPLHQNDDCNHLIGLAKRQTKICKRNVEVMDAVRFGANIALKECQHQFKNRRWNCSFIDPKSIFGSALMQGTRETAFVHALSAAAVAHSVTFACSRGGLDKCGCDRSIRGKSQKGFEWAGCSDNIIYGVAFSEKFVDARERLKGKHMVRGLMNVHNNNAGRITIVNNMKTNCKCHGVSGSCELKTCWRAMPSFRVVGTLLKDKFDGATEVKEKKKGPRVQLSPINDEFKQHTERDLVYLAPSPDFCEPDHRSGSLGTRGRLCNRSSRAIDGCELLCCGRGFVTKKRTVIERCNCKFVWCCDVKCQKCERDIEEHFCRWFVQTVHGEFFSRYKWETFLRQRAVPGSGVTFAEIEVMLCNIPSKVDLLEEEEQQKREQEERQKREKDMQKLMTGEKDRRKRQREEERRKQEEEEKRRRMEMERRIREDQEDRVLREKEKEEAERRKRELEEEEERGKLESDEREKQEKERKEKEEAEKKQRVRSELEEARRLRELEERRKREEEEKRLRELEEAENYERLLKEAHEKEKEAMEEADHHNKRFKSSKDDKLKKEAEEAEKRARLKQREWKNKRIRYALKVAIKKRDRERLPPAVREFKEAKLPDDDMDLQKAEKILREFSAKDGLLEAMANPHRNGLDKHIENLENAINFIKRNGMDYMFTHELIEANKLLLQLKKRYKIYAEIMALDQPTVAEIKSYSKPPVLVHQVMTGVFVMLGHKEKEMKDWQNVRIWVGKTGKDGLKRRCLEYLKEPEKVVPKDADKTRELLENIDLDDVRDTSAGAATFYVWAWTMVEETEVRLREMKEEEEKRKAEREAKKKEKEASKQGNEESAGAEEAKASTETPKSSEPGSPQKGILKQSPTSKPSSPEKEMSKPGSPEEATSKPGSPEKETTAGDTGQAGETSGNQGGSEANAEVGKDGNTADSTEFTSKRVGKESKEKFTLTKTGKMKKTKDNSDEKRENKET